MWWPTPAASFATLACRLLACQSSSTAAPSVVVLEQCFFFFSFLLAGVGEPQLQFRVWVSSPHTCAHMPVYANTFARMSAHFDKRGLSCRATQSRPQRSLDTRLHTGAGVPPARLALLRLTYKQPGICHRRGGGGCHTCTHTSMQTCKHIHTQTHGAGLLSAAGVAFWPFDRYTKDLQVRGEASEQVYKSETCPLQR